MAWGQASGIATVYLLLAVATTAFCASIGYWVSRKRSVRGWRYFALMMANDTIWAGLTTVHVYADEPWILRTAVRVEPVFALAAAILWTGFCVRFANSDLPERRWAMPALVLAAGTILVLVAANPWRATFADVHVSATPFVHAGPVRGPGYVAATVIIYGLVATSFVVLLRFLSSTRRNAREQVLFPVLGVLSMLALNVLSVFDALPVTGFEHASYGLLPFTLLTTLGIFRFGLMEIEPVARDTVIETLDDAIVVVNADRRISDFNPKAEELAPDLPAHVGDPLAEVLPVLDERLSSPDPGKVATDQLSLRTPEGVRYFSVRVSPLTRDVSRNSVIGYTVLLRDITELEESRRELAIQNEQLDRFASIVSHDLKNPISVINGYRALLEAELDDAADVDVDALAEFVETIDDATVRMEAIIEDVLALTRGSKAVDETEPIPFGTVAREAWATVETGDATLAIERDGTIRADRSRLRSILENLFANTVEHTDGRVFVTAALDGDGFSIVDTGPGISEGVVDQVFEYGFTTNESGTGLGLPIVRSMAESHGWSVSIDASYDDGARFVFDGAIVDA